MSCSDIPEYDLSVYQGDDKTFLFRHRVGTELLDLTNYTITFECADIALSREAVIANQVTNKGEYSVIFVPADTENTASSRVKFEVVFWPTGLAGIKNTKFVGTLKVVQEVV
jgi:hypothetical protein